MREIKFRAFDKKNKTMHVNSIPKDIDYWDGVETCSLSMINSLLAGDEFEFMQFSGIKDSKGDDIYEGDIISFFTSHKLIDKQIVKERDYEIAPIIFHDGGFYTSKDDDLAIGKWLVDSECEVMGNIYENKELL